MVQAVEEADKITAEALSFKGKTIEEDTTAVSKMAAVAQLSQVNIEKINQMNKDMYSFSKKLNLNDYHQALKIQKELRDLNIAQGDTSLAIRTQQLFADGFKKFSDIAVNQDVEDQLNQLEIAQENLNRNHGNQKSLDNFVQKTHEVEKYIEGKYGDMWENPLKN